MAWSYDASKLSINTTAQVRLLIGDTITTDPQLQDEEIGFLLTQRATIYGACAEACRSIAATKSRLADSVQGEMRTMYSSISRRYASMASTFEAKAAMGGSGIPYAGGISVADKQNQEQNTDRVPPQFNIGMDDNALPLPSEGNETLDQVNDTGTGTEQTI